MGAVTPSTYGGAAALLWLFAFFLYNVRTFRNDQKKKGIDIVWQQALDVSHLPQISALLPLVVDLAFTCPRPAWVALLAFVACAAGWAYTRGGRRTFVGATIVVTTAALAQPLFSNSQMVRNALSATLAAIAAAWCLDDNSTQSRQVRLLLVGEIAILLVLCGADEALRHGGTHLTWWGVAMVCALDFAQLTSNPKLVNPVAGAQCIIGATVLLGTVLLSAFKCDMLVTTFDDLGPVAYVAGNTVIHYYPATRGLLSAFSLPEITKGSVAAAFSLAGAYTTVVDVQEIYGCFRTDKLVARVAVPLLTLLIGFYAIKKNAPGGERQS